MNRQKLEDLSLKVSSGITPSRSNPDYWDHGTIPWLKTAQLGVRNIYDTSEKITNLALAKTSIRINPKNTLSIAMYGEGKTRGKVSILRNEMTTNQACCNVVLDEKKADPEFVYYCLKNQYKKLRNLSSGVRKNLNSADIKGFEISIPEALCQQRGIANILSSIDDKIELNHQINEELEGMAKLLYDYWFVQFDFPITAGQASAIKSPQLEGKPYRSSGGKMVYNETLKHEIPEGWEDQPLENMIESDKSGDWGKDEVEGNYRSEVYCIRGTDLNSLNGIGQTTPPKRFILEKNSFKLLKPNDVIVEISGGSSNQSTGRASALTESVFHRFNKPLICSNFCKAISLNDSASAQFFYRTWDRLYHGDVFFNWEGKTSGIKNLLFESFTTHHSVVNPSREVLRGFNDVLAPLERLKQENLLQNQQLTELRDWLLPMLMNGQIIVD